MMTTTRYQLPLRRREEENSQPLSFPLPNQSKTIDQVLEVVLSQLAEET
jgi:hypothetical protein